MSRYGCRLGLSRMPTYPSSTKEYIAFTTLAHACPRTLLKAPRVTPFVFSVGNLRFLLGDLRKPLILYFTGLPAPSSNRKLIRSVSNWMGVILDDLSNLLTMGSDNMFSMYFLTFSISCFSGLPLSLDNFFPSYSLFRCQYLISFNGII